MHYNRGDFVWGKVKGFPWWPAIVLAAADCDKEEPKPNNYLLFWFGHHTVSQLNQINIKLFKRRFAGNVKKSSSKEFMKSVEEAIKVLAIANDMNHDDLPFLMSWAFKGFQSTWPVQFQWVKKDLPNLIQVALIKLKESNEKSSGDHVENIIKKVKAGEQLLEDICIGCCKEDVSLVESHPLFVGQVCEKCTKDVSRANRQPTGKYQNYCVVCGQGGNLVYCSEKTCCRAFCEECIQYLHSKDAFTKIVSDNEWECYVCHPVMKKNCLIKKRLVKRENSQVNAVAVWKPTPLTPTQSKTVAVWKSKPVTPTQSKTVAVWKSKPVTPTRSKTAAVKKTIKRERSIQKYPEAAVKKTIKRARTIQKYPEDAAERLIKKVLKNEKSLEEICIGCCKEDFPLIEPHPLFVGKVCAACKKDVDRANRLPVGRHQIYCVVCGQGGNLVFCSQKICYRAFCEECIQYLHSKDTFIKIVSENEWECYLCHPVTNNNCLIQKRLVKRKNSQDNSVAVWKSTSRTPSQSKTVAVWKSTSLTPARSKTAAVRKTIKRGHTMQKYPEDAAERVIKKVRKNEKFLEEICIGCCKEDFPLIEPHPLFVGKVCAACKKDVDRINRLPVGRHQIYCVVCGQGGNLVFCSQKICYRAFCEECIQYLHSKDAFTKIVSDNEWECYLCHPVTNNNCLIQKRLVNRKNSQDNAVAVWKPTQSKTAAVQRTTKRERTIQKYPEGGAERVIKKVRNNEKFLEEICIGCCKEDSPLVEPHSLFVGKVCAACKKDVDRANRLPIGRHQIYCVVCGQGGKLVFCSQKSCYRAYCEECIEYLDSKKAFEQILSDEIWNCYVCKPVKRKKCLIKKRETQDDDSDSDSGSTSDTPNDSKIGFVISKVLQGLLSLEDICIACCEEDLKIVDVHPLFVGGICEECKKDVMKVCSAPSGKYQNFCVICGQGGSLVFCDGCHCLRAYCRLCIEWLDCGIGAYAEIEKTKNWLCYLCKPSLSTRCLIKKRNPFRGYMNYAGTSFSMNASTFGNTGNNRRFVSSPVDVSDSESCEITFASNNRSPISESSSSSPISDITNNVRGYSDCTFMSSVKPSTSSGISILSSANSFPFDLQLKIQQLRECVIAPTPYSFQKAPIREKIKELRDCAIAPTYKSFDRAPIPSKPSSANTSVLDIKRNINGAGDYAIVPTYKSFERAPIPSNPLSANTSVLDIKRNINGDGDYAIIPTYKSFERAPIPSKSSSVNTSVLDIKRNINGAGDCIIAPISESPEKITLSKPGDVIEDILKGEKSLED